jgi:hypothetical protein
MRYAHFVTHHNEYLTKDNKLTKDIKQAILIEEEVIGELISRFKFGIKYLACKDGEIYFAEKIDPATLFVKQRTYLHGIYHYITIKGKCLCIGNRLRCENQLENNEFPPSFTNLMIDYLNEEDVFFERYQQDGIIFWEHYYWGDNLFETLKEKILSKNVDDIFLFFFFHNFILQSCISTSLKGMLRRIFPDGYHLNDYSFNKIPYHKILPASSTEILKVQVIFALDDLNISYKPQSFLSCDTFFEETLNIPKGNIVLLRRNLWYRILSSSTFLIVNYSSM